MALSPDQSKIQSGKRSWLRVGILIGSYVGLLVAGHFGSDWLIGSISADLSSAIGAHANRMVMAAIALYSVLLAIPFVPGVEISLTLLAAFGKLVAVPIYFATIIGLSAAYLIGRLVPIGSIGSLFGSAGLAKATALIRRLEPLDAEQRLDVLLENAPRRILPHLLKHRYIAIAIALNVPGNAVIGGGGGIALLAGVSGLFTFPRFLFVVCIAVLPIPLAVVLMSS